MAALARNATLAALAAAVALAPFAARAADERGPRADIYVNPASSDSCNGKSAAAGASGTCAKATLEGARSAVAALIAGNPARNYKVLLRGGRYVQTGPVRFTKIDRVDDGFSVSYEAYPGETPIIEGGYRIGGWASDGSGAWSVNLVRQGVWPAAATGVNKKYYFGSIWVNGVRRFHPIYPDRGQRPLWTTTDATFAYGAGLSETATFRAGNPNIIVADVQNYSPQSHVNFGADATAGLVPNTLYYVNSVGANTITLTSKLGDPSAIFRPSASGPHTAYFSQAHAINWGNNVIPSRATKNGVKVQTNRFGYAPGDMDPATVLTGDEKIEVFRNGKSLAPIYAISATEVTLNSKIPVNAMTFIAGTPYRRHNIPSDLAPGHFYLTRAGVIKYWPLPGENMATAEIYAPLAKELLRVSNSRDDWTAQGNVGGPPPVTAGNLRFAGLTFQHTNTTVDTCEHSASLISCGLMDDATSIQTGDGAITLIGAKNVVFDNVEVAHLGEGGIAAVMGSSYWTVENSLIHDAGTYGLMGGGGLTDRNTYEYASAGSKPSTPYFKKGDDGSLSARDGFFKIRNNEIFAVGKLQGATPGLSLLAHSGAVIEHNYIHDVASAAAILAQSINNNTTNIEDNRSARVEWNRFDNGGVEEDVYGVLHAGYSCTGDMGLRYSASNLGGNGVSAERWLESHNVYTNMASCPYQNTIFDLLKPQGPEAVGAYFDEITSFNYDFVSNIVANSTEKMAVITGLYGVNSTANIFYGKFRRGYSMPSYSISQWVSASHIFPGTYKGSSPTYINNQKNILAFDGGGVNPSNAHIDTWGTLSSHPDWAAMASSLYYQYDGKLTRFGARSTLAEWAALPSPAGGLQDAGYQVADPNFKDLSFRSPQIFASTGDAPLCSDGAQRSPACAMPQTSNSPFVGFPLWDPSKAGLLEPRPRPDAESGPIVITTDDSIVQNLAITAANGVGVDLNGHDRVTIRNVTIRHGGASPSAGIKIHNARDVAIENVAIENVAVIAGTPSGAASAQAVNIECYNSPGLTIANARLSQGRGGVRLQQCQDSAISGVETYDEGGRRPLER